MSINKEAAPVAPQLISTANSNPGQSNAGYSQPLQQNYVSRINKTE